MARPTCLIRSDTNPKIQKLRREFTPPTSHASNGTYGSRHWETRAAILGYFERQRACFAQSLTYSGCLRSIHFGEKDHVRCARSFIAIGSRALENCASAASIGGGNCSERMPRP